VVHVSDIKANDNDRSVVLHGAVWEDHKCLAHLLVEHDPDATAKNEDRSVIFCDTGEQCGPHTFSSNTV
jgi:hypothetical protein